jgi:hypothetical protein
MESTEECGNRLIALALLFGNAMACWDRKNEVSVRNDYVKYSPIRQASKPPTDDPIR